MFEFETKSFDEETSGRSGVLRHTHEIDENILTPTRAITNVDVGRVDELRKAADIFRGGIEDVPNGIMEITYPYYGHKLTTLTQSEPSTHQANLLAQYIYEVNKVALFNPLFSFSKGIKLTRKEIEMLIALQAWAKYSPITISEPHPFCSLSEFSKMLEFGLESVDKQTREKTPVVVQLSTATKRELIESKLKVAKDLGISGAILNYASIPKYFDVYYALSQLTKGNEFNKFFFHLSCVPPTFFNASLMNILVSLGLDSFALRGIVFGSKSKEVVVKEKRRKISWFNKNSWGFDDVTQWINKKESIGCNCSVENNRTKKEFIDLYTGTDTLSEATGIHNTISTNYELEKSRVAIEQSKLFEYINSKFIGKAAFKNIQNAINQSLERDLTSF